MGGPRVEPFLFSGDDASAAGLNIQRKKRVIPPNGRIAVGQSTASYEFTSSQGGFQNGKFLMAEMTVQELSTPRFNILYETLGSMKSLGFIPSPSYAPQLFLPVLASCFFIAC